MARKKKDAIAAPEALEVPAPANLEKAAAPAGPSLAERVTELEGDLARVVELLVKGDLEAAKFREILAKRQGKA